MQSELEDAGALVHAGLILAKDLSQCASLFSDLDDRQAGKRITSSTLNEIRAIGRASEVVTHHMGKRALPVRATLFDKRAGRNWALAWHQDRTIAVKECRDVEGYGPWTVKSGIRHVVPPAALLASMLTVRIHIDRVDAENAPLLIAPGSHKLGLIAEADIAAVVAHCGTRECLAEAGDVWIYSTLILHASARAAVPRRRRVLQIDFSADTLPGGLEWATLEQPPVLP